MAVDQLGHLLSDSTVAYFPPAELIVGLQGPEEAKNLAGKALRLIQICLTTPSLQKTSPACQVNSP